MRQMLPVAGWLDLDCMIGFTCSAQCSAPRLPWKAFLKVICIVLNTPYTSVWWSISLRQRYSFTVLLFTSVYMERLMNITNVDIWDMELSTSSFMLMLFNLFSDRRLCLKTLIISYFHCVSLCFFFFSVCVKFVYHCYQCTHLHSYWS